MPPRHEVRWGVAIAYGVGAALIGGFAWGVIAAFAGYIFIWGAILIGLFVGWAIQKGGGRITSGAIGLAAALTLLAVYIGDIVSLSIIALDLGISPVDVIVNYPAILAFAPGEAAATYIFGVIGVGAVVFWLRSQMRAQNRPMLVGPSPRIAQAPQAGPTAAMSAPAQPEGPGIETLARGAKAAVRVTTKTSPPRILEAAYQTMTGAATVTLDGRPFKKVRVWGFEKVIDVHLGGDPPQTISFRFYGVAPRIEVRVNGKVVGTV